MAKLHTIGSAVFIACAAAVYGNGLTEADLVNTQQLEVKGVGSIAILYSSDAVKLFRGDSDLLVIKEYMSIDDSDYYVRVSYATAANAEKRLVIESGERPVVSIGNFNSRVEVYIPALFTGAVAVKTTSGSIRSDDALSFAAISLESSSGSISVDDVQSDTTALVKATSGTIRIQNIAAKEMQLLTNSGSISVDDVQSDTTALVKATSGTIRVQRIVAKEMQLSTNSGSIHCGTAGGNTAITTTSGSIDFERVNGDVVAESMSGSINLKMVTGSLRVKTVSGSLRCAVAESAGDIALSAISGNVTLDVPKNLGFRFSAKMTSGSLFTPFSDRLYSPFSDRHSATGTIEAKGLAEHELISIDITTTSGSIRVGWI